MKVAISGATGFVGTKLVQYLELRGVQDVIVLPRDITSLSLEGVNIVVNLVGRAHILKELLRDSALEYKAVNCDYALRLYKKSVSAQVDLFIQISSIGVLGNETLGFPFDENSCYAPKEEYAKSKVEAELRLLKLAKNSTTGLCIVRPPLIYGKGAKGNFGLLEYLSSKSLLILPFGRLNNRKDFVSIYNFCDFLFTCIVNSELVKGKVLLVTDGESVSTFGLLKLMLENKGNKFIEFNTPMFILKSFFFIIGKNSSFKKISSNLEVDASYSKKLLNWTPPYSVAESIKKDFG